MCGEKICISFRTNPVEGSPPRVRGEVVADGVLVRVDEDHPRVCGEKQKPRVLHGAFVGSPPRVRGEDIGG